jgi:hypothetical protein
MDWRPVWSLELSSDQFYEWKPTLKWRKYFWTGKWVTLMTWKFTWNWPEKIWSSISFLLLNRIVSNFGVLVEISWPERLRIARLHDLNNGKKHYSWRYLFYYRTELIQILVSLRYEYILYKYYFFYFKYCVLVEISWPEGLRIARLYDLKMEIQTYNRLYFFLLLTLNRIESKLGQFEIWIYIL